MLQNSHEQSIFATLKPTRARFFLLQRTDPSASKNTPRREKQTETRNTTIYSSPWLQFPLNVNPRDLTASRTFSIDPFSPTEFRIWKLDRSHNQSPKSSSVGFFYPLNSSCDSLLRITISTLQWLCVCFLGSSVASLCFRCSSLFSEETREGRWKREGRRTSISP